MGAKTLMTVDEFAQLNTASTEDYELVQGELIPLSSAKPRHAIIRARLERLLGMYFDTTHSGGVLGEVEVLSPSESITEVHRKTLEYLDAGSQEVWQLDSVNQEIFVQTSAGIRLLRGVQLLETPLLPGFSARVDLLLAGR